MTMLLVHGVDISMLEGWMIKINNNPSVFGKNTSRRWFRVGYVTAGGDQRLIISYSTNKTSKEPRGWLFIEDVSGVYCRRDMIEVVSPARTLRFKGETTVEHRLWSDSLHRLCNPPKAAPPKLEVMAPAADHKARDKKPSERESTPADTRAASNEAAAAQTRANEVREREEQTRLAASARAERDKLKEQAEREESSRKKRSDSFDRRRRHSSRSISASDRSDRGEQSSDDDYSPRTGRRNSLDKAPSSREQDRPSSREQQRNVSSASRDNDRELHTRQASREPTPRREDDDYERNSPPRTRRQYSSDHNSSDDSDSEDDRDRVTKPAISSSDPCRPSLLVAQIKATSARNAEPKLSRVPTAARREDEPPVATKPPVEAKDEEEEEQQRPASLSIPLDRTPAVQHAKSSVQHDDDSEDDDPEEETPRDESAHEPMDSPPKRAQAERVSNHTSAVAEEIRTKPTKQTEYFDSDEEDEEQDNHDRPQPAKSISRSEPVKAPAAAVSATDGISRDNNFVEEDWDAEDEPPSTQKKALPMVKSPEKRTGGVTADANWVSDTWDD